MDVVEDMAWVTGADEDGVSGIKMADCSADGGDDKDASVDG